MKDAKFYGLCLERLRFQIANAKRRCGASGSTCQGVLIECYNTGDPEEIIDILELYDIEDRSINGVLAKLDELAYTASILTREKLGFGLTGKGELGLYVAVSSEQEAPAHAESAAEVAAV